MHDAERNEAFKKFNPRYFMYIGPGSQETWIFERYRDNLRGKWYDISTEVTDSYTVDKSILFCDDFQTPKSVGLTREG